MESDNAKEFRARALVRGCEQHGIQIVHRSVNDRGEYDSTGSRGGLLISGMSCMGLSQPPRPTRATTKSKHPMGGIFAGIDTPLWKNQSTGPHDGLRPDL
jgi:hypothetical protein